MMDFTEAFLKTEGMPYEEAKKYMMENTDVDESIIEDFLLSGMGQGDRQPIDGQEED